MDKIIHIVIIIAILLLTIRILPDIAGDLLTLIAAVLQIALAILLIPIIGTILFVGFDIGLFVCMLIVVALLG